PCEPADDDSSRQPETLPGAGGAPRILCAAPALLLVAPGVPTRRDSPGGRHLPDSEDRSRPDAWIFRLDPLSQGIGKSKMVLMEPGVREPVGHLSHEGVEALGI